MTDLILDGGLDMVRARPAVLPGFIRNCLNYEIGWRRGYSRIDGFERYDGRTSPSTTTGWTFLVPPAAVTGTFVKPETLTWTNANATGPAGVLVNVEDDTTEVRFYMMFRSGQRRPQYGDTITGDVSGASFEMDDIVAGSVFDFPTYYPTHDAYLQALEQFATTLHGEVQPVPGGGTIVGLHYHEDQLYAIRDTAQFTVPVGQEGVLVPGMYVINPRDQIGEVVAVDGSAATRMANVTAVDARGFDVIVGDVLEICLSVRYKTGKGVWGIGDGVDFATSDWIGEVGFIDTRDGSWESGNSLGVAVFVNPAAPVAVVANEIINNTTTPASTMVLESLLFSDTAGTVTVETASSMSTYATMWRSTDAGWEAATKGRQLPFKLGKQDPSQPVTNSKTKSATEAGIWSSSTLNPDWADPENVLLDDALYATTFVYVDSFSNIRPSDFLYVRGFNVGLLDTDVVTGYEVLIKGSVSPISGTSWSASLLYNSKQGYTAPGTNAGNVVVYSLGGPDTVWGSGQTPVAVNASKWGFKIRATCGTLAGGGFSAGFVQVKVHYTSPGESKLYIWGGASDIGYIRVSSVVVTGGSWAADDAVGYFRVSDWSVTNIPSGLKIYTLPGGPAGGGAEVATTQGLLTLLDLPGSLLLDENVSKYQMISYNFYASEEKNAIYGVSGAGLAFWYDGVTLDFISTGVGIEVDKPRHIAPHENRLALGYKWGEVYLSGPDPLDFSADTGLAASFGFGDKITGLMPAPGKALAVFTESTTNVLIGAPQSWGVEALATVDQQTINHKVGAIEYTVQNVGNAPIFASFRGIETLETMDQYSNFFTAPLTYNVSSWLLERLQAAAGVEAANKSVVNSVVVRNKNQYRLFFADGYLLTLTFVGPEKEPQMSIQQYWFQDDRAKYARCYATASGVTTDGHDRAFFSVEQRPAGPSPSQHIVGENIDFVYELDRGRSFDGYEIEANFDLTFYFSVGEQGEPAPSRSTRMSTFHLHGACAGTADLRMATTANYEDLDDPVLPYESVPFYDSSLPAQDKPSAKYTKGRMTERGFAVSFHLAHKSKLEFPHTIQMISFVGQSPLKQDT